MVIGVEVILNVSGGILAVGDGRFRKDSEQANGYQ
jgi:hypothetical protein